MGSQADQILAHLKKGELLTPLEALKKFGCLRLAARVYDLRNKGHNIQVRMLDVKGGKKVACYWLGA